MSPRPVFDAILSSGHQGRTGDVEGLPGFLVQVRRIINHVIYVLRRKPGVKNILCGGPFRLVDGEIWLYRKLAIVALKVFIMSRD